MPKLKIITAASPNFLRYARGLEASIKRYLPKAEFYCLMGTTQSPMYYAHVRGKLLQDHITWEGGHVVWVDADSIFVKEGSGFIEHVCSCDLTMRPKGKDWSKARCFASGVIGVRDSAVMDQFCADYDREIKRCEKKKKPWYADQKALNNMYASWKGKIDIKHLPFKYCDTRMSDEGVLWTAKGEEGRANSRYVQELEKYGL